MLQRNIWNSSIGRSILICGPSFLISFSNYSQFIIYLGSIVFPYITLLGLVANILEYPANKFRMLRLSQTPKWLDISLKKMINFYMIIIALCALLLWPQGAAFIMSNTRTTALGKNQQLKTLLISFQIGYNCCTILPNDLGPSFNASVCNY